MLSQDEKDMIAKGYPIPGLYAQSQKRRDAAAKEWALREARINEIDAKAAPHF